MKDSTLRESEFQSGKLTAQRERRLEAIRLQARQSGRVGQPGVHPAGSPIPVASIETGYYGIPLLKEPQWSWEIPVYFFVGGAAGAAAVIAEFAQMTGAKAEVVRDARTVAAIGAVLSPALLVSDLGMPSRFLNMLRVFKVQSPMSVGVYIVSAFAPTTMVAAIANWVRRGSGGIMLKLVEGGAGLFSALAGLGMATYTGVLIGATAVPVWNRNIDTLPVHFALSGLAAGTSAIQLMGHEESRALNVLGLAANLGETLAGVKLESQKQAANEPLKKGTSGIITRLGGVLTGPVPLALRLIAAMTGGARSKQLVRIAAISSLAGSFCTRVGWIRAGHSSARDYRLPLEIEPARSPKLALAQTAHEEINDSAFAKKSREALG